LRERRDDEPLLSAEQDVAAASWRIEPHPLDTTAVIPWRLPREVLPPAQALTG
jgi:hypothetical protein